MSKNEEIYKKQKELSYLTKELKNINKLDIILNRGYLKKPMMVKAKEGTPYHFDIYAISEDKEVAIQEKNYIKMDSDIIKENIDCLRYKDDIKTITNIRKELESLNSSFDELFNKEIVITKPSFKVRSTKTAMSRISLDKYQKDLENIKNPIEKVIYIKENISKLEKELKDLGEPNRNDKDFNFFFSEYDKKETLDFTSFSLDDIKIKDSLVLNKIFIERVLDNKETLKALQEKGIDCSTIVDTKYSILASGKHEEILKKTEHMANGYEKNNKQKEAFFNMIKGTLETTLDMEMN